MARKHADGCDVLYVDDHIVAVNKSAGIPVVATRSGKDVPLRECVARHLGGEPPYVVHRIDKDTSGVVLFARDLETHRTLSLMFEHREVEKTYLAMVRGRPLPAEGTIDLPLQRDKRNPTRMVIARRGGKPSQTAYRTTACFRGYSLVEVRSLTGRMHQIRVHLSAIGHPLAVDCVYGGAEALYLSEFKPDYRRKEGREERPLISRLSLHANRLSLNHPVSGCEIRVEAPPPSDFAVSLRQLAKHASLARER